MVLVYNKLLLLMVIAVTAEYLFINLEKLNY